MTADQLKQHLKDKVKQALDNKYSIMVGYIDDLVDDMDDGVDPEFNIDEFIKDLDVLI